MNTYFNQVKGQANIKVKTWNKGFDSFVHYSLSRGHAILTNQHQLDKYLQSYGAMHQAKLQLAFDQLTALKTLSHQTIDVIDYGCGQALGSIVLSDYLNQHLDDVWFNSFTLIDPSKMAVNKGANFMTRFDRNASINVVNKKLSALQKSDLLTSADSVKIHLFSNILDVNDFSIYDLFNKISATQSGINLFICVSPGYKSKVGNSARLDDFFHLFKSQYSVKNFINLPNKIVHPRGYKDWTLKGAVFKVLM